MPKQKKDKSNRIQCPHCPAKVKPKYYDSHIRAHNIRYEPKE